MVKLIPAEEVFEKCAKDPKFLQRYDLLKFKYDLIRELIEVGLSQSETEEQPSKG